MPESPAVERRVLRLLWSFPGFGGVGTCSLTIISAGGTYGNLHAETVRYSFGIDWTDLPFDEVGLFFSNIKLYSKYKNSLWGWA